MHRTPTVAAAISKAHVVRTEPISTAIVFPENLKLQRSMMIGVTIPPNGRV